MARKLPKYFSLPFQKLKQTLVFLFCLLAFFSVYSNMSVIHPWKYLTNSQRSKHTPVPTANVDTLEILKSEFFIGNFYSHGVERNIFRTNHIYRKARNEDKAAMERVRPLFWDTKKNVTKHFAKEKKIQKLDILENDEKLIVFDSSFYRTTGNDPWEWKWNGIFSFLETPQFVCPRKCAFTDDEMFLKNADAVVFNYEDLADKLVSNPKRYNELEVGKEKQVWIVSTMEPPGLKNIPALEKHRFSFDWSLTYRVDADIYWPHGYFHKLEKSSAGKDAILSPKTELKEKRLAASLTSSCNSSSGRELLMQEMKRYIEVDEYGPGKTMSCLYHECRENVGSNYKFVLAIESFLCKDYIAEDFFQVFTTNAVPVAFGLGNYTAVAPPHSYINALDFPNVKALTDFLVYLDKNDEEYLKYFQWRFNYAVHAEKPTLVAFCQVCKKLWEEDSKSEERLLYLHDFDSHTLEHDTNHQENHTIFSLLRNATSCCASFGDLKRFNYFSS